MVKCIRDWCGHQEITGRPFWLAFFRPGQPKRDEPHCTDCAKKVRGPQIEATLKDARTLMNTFGGIVDLADLGRVEMVGGKPVVHGRLGAPIVLFKHGQIFPAQGAASTLLAEEQYRIGKRTLEAIDHLFPHARYREQHLITERLAYVKEKMAECEVQRGIVEEHRLSQQMIPTDSRRAFRNLASDIFINAKGMLDEIGESFRQKERADHVSKEDGLLIEAVKGFNPAALVSKEEEESVGEEVLPETPPEEVAEVPAEVPAAEAPPAGEVEAEEPAGETPEPEVEREEEAVPEPEAQERVPVADATPSPQPAPTHEERTEAVLDNGIRVTGPPQAVEEFAAVANSEDVETTDEPAQLPEESSPPVPPKKGGRRKKKS